MALVETRRSGTGKRLNIHINRFVAKVITPVVLVAGLLLLLLMNYRGVLDTTKTQVGIYHGQTTYSVEGLQATFQQDAGVDRPAVTYEGAPVLTWQEWSSSVSVDGNVSNLWDSFHGYDYDATKHQVFATMSGKGWQVVEVVTLVDAHTVRVDYQFVAGHQGLRVPKHIVLSISHYHNTLYQPVVAGNTLAADVLPGNVANFQAGMVLHPWAKITLALSGPQVAPDPFAFDDLRGNATDGGTVQQIANSFTTTYVLDDPQVNRLTPLGTETLTFTNTLPSNVPVPGVGPTPTVS